MPPLHAPWPADVPEAKPPAHNAAMPPPFRYEHLVEINDLRMPLLTPVSRPQLWRALVLRAEVPTTFMPVLEGFRIDARRTDAAGHNVLERTLNFGRFVVEDCVRLTPEHEVVFDTRAGPTWPQSQLTVRIEAPQPDALFLRFVYESADEALDEVSDTLRRQAWHAADLDMVVRIRELAEDNQLD